MSIDKVLQRIQGQINELAPGLELFIEDTIQPTTEQCDELQKQLKVLEESLVVYKYLRQNKELSPSFNLHAKVSEALPPPDAPVQKPAAPIAEPVAGPLKEEKIMETPPVKTELKEAIVESIRSEPPAPGRNIVMAINDKFRFVNELFAQNGSEYGIAIEQLNTVRTWHDAEIYLNSLKSLYGWKDNSEIAKHFYAVVKKRFD